MSLIIDSLNDGLSSAVVLDLPFLVECLQKCLWVNIQVLAERSRQFSRYWTLVDDELHDTRQEVDAILEVFRQWVYSEAVVLNLLGLDVEGVYVDDDAAGLVDL